MADTEKCNICGKTFENSNKLNQHKQESHQGKAKNLKVKTSQSSRYKATGIAAAIAVIIVIAVYLSGNQTPSASTVDGIECLPTEATVFHVHAHLDLIVNSKSVTIPAGIGIIPNQCFYWLHTHTPDGIIHIEAPQQRNFTIGQFVKVWDNTPGISPPTFEDLTLNDNNLKIFVNGNEVNGTLDNMQLSAHDEIVIISGNVPPTIPSYYQFSPGL